MGEGWDSLFHVTQTLTHMLKERENNTLNHTVSVHSLDKEGHLVNSSPGLDPKVPQSLEKAAV